RADQARLDHGLGTEDVSLLVAPAFGHIRVSARVTGPLIPLYGGSMAAEQGPSIDWLTAQPYDDWRQLRTAECPVVSVGDMMAVGADMYQVARYHDAETVLRDDKTFSSSINAEHIGQFMGDLILAMNGDEHRKYRNLVAKAFRASQLEKWDDSLVRPTINR